MYVLYCLCSSPIVLLAFQAVGVLDSAVADEAIVHPVTVVDLIPQVEAVSRAQPVHQELTQHQPEVIRGVVALIPVAPQIQLSIIITIHMVVVGVLVVADS